MSISKKFFSALALVAIASSVLPSTTAHAADGVISGTASNLVFCNGAATPAAPSANQGTTAGNLTPGGTYYVARNSQTAITTPTAVPAGINASGQCINTVAVSGIPSYSNHRTSFTVRLDGTVVSVSNVIVSNNAPTVPTTTVCVVKDGRANFMVTDSEADQVTATPVVSPINGFANGTGNSIQYTPNSGYVGTDTFSFDIQDKVMQGGETLAATVTPNAGLTAGTNDATFSVNPSGIRLSRVNLTAIVVEKSSDCPASSSSSMSSSMMSSMMSSSMMSSMDSSMMSSSMKSSMMSSTMPTAAVVYVEVPVSGKGMTIRTGANN